MKLKVVIVDLEIPTKVKKWGLRIGIPLGLLLGGGAIAWAAGLHTWNTGDTLNATDLNGNFTYVQSEIGTLQGQVHPASAFRYELTTPTTVQPMTTTTIPFNSKLYDLAGEYAPSTGVFSPKQAGTYLVQCGFYFAGSDGVLYAAQIQDNGADISDFNAQAASSTGQGVSTATSAIVNLAAGDAVVCTAYQDSSSAMPIVLNFTGRNFFDAARLY